MLGTIARKLRIFGFDTLYIAHTHDDEVLKTGIEQGRTILTADKELFKRIVKAGAKGVLVDGASDLEDLAHILSKSGITSISFGGAGSRCSICNGVLSARAPEQVRAVVPDNVLVRHEEFYQCDVCSKVYWEGSHLRRIRNLAKTLDGRLGKAVSA
jgi:uncharacterized protein with PIN domain